MAYGPKAMGHGAMGHGAMGHGALHVGLRAHEGEIGNRGHRE